MEFSQEQVDAHETLTKAGWKIVQEEALIAGRAPKPAPGFFARRRLRKGIQLFTDALKINPNGWPSMWGIGKLYQRLGDQAAALKWFTEAHRIKPDQPDVLREAGLAALDIGAKEEALKLCFAAVRAAPDDLGLQSNLALAYLLVADDEHAEECTRVAVSRAPEDTISQAVLKLVLDVRQGKRRRPERMAGIG
jgi:tetratricopeptide (TPR) repeat protein